MKRHPDTMSTTKADENRTLFLWRDVCNDPIDPGERNACPFCGCTTEKLDMLDWGRSTAEDEVDDLHECPLCGWYYRHAAYVRGDTQEPNLWGVTRSPVLREFDLSSEHVAFHELGSHLRARYSDVYVLHWRRFEELIEHVFRNHGFHTVLTQKSKDDGADILVLSDGRIEALVECKKYSASRTVGVGTVRALVGACVDFDLHKASLVTCASISDVARSYAERQARHGFQIDLVDASRLLKLLKVYNTGVPSLHLLGPHDREEWIAKGRQRLHQRQQWHRAGGMESGFASQALRLDLQMDFFAALRREAATLDETLSCDSVDELRSIASSIARRHTLGPTPTEILSEPGLANIRGLLTREQAAAVLDMSVEDFWGSVTILIGDLFLLMPQGGESVRFCLADLLLLLILMRYPFGDEEPPAGVISTSRTTVLIGDGNYFSRDALRQFLASDQRLEVCGVVASSDDLMKSLATLKPEVVVVSMLLPKSVEEGVIMPELPMFEATRTIRSEYPATRVLFCADQEDPDYAVEAMAAGASGYVVKKRAAKELSAAIGLAMADEPFLSPRILSGMLDDFRERCAAPPNRPLTATERAILCGLAEGHSTREIAVVLGKTPKEVEMLKFSLMRALELHNRPGIADYVRRQRIVR